MIKRISDLPSDEQNAIIEKLSNVKIEEFNAESQLKIWTTLRKVISRHREYPTADWSMPTELTDRLEKIYERFTPEDIIAQCA